VHYAGVGEATATARESQVRRLGRRLGIGAFSAVVGSFTIVCSVQICLQVWDPPIKDIDVDCATGTLGLIEAVLEARSAASRETTEHDALARFRAAVAEPWSMRPALDRACSADPSAVRHLREIDRLRYAEEHAVRYSSVDLSRRRHAVQSLMPALVEAVRATGR